MTHTPLVSLDMTHTPLVSLDMTHTPLVSLDMTHTRMVSFDMSSLEMSYWRDVGLDIGHVWCNVFLGYVSLYVSSLCRLTTLSYLLESCEGALPAHESTTSTLCSKHPRTLLDTIDVTSASHTHSDHARITAEWLICSKRRWMMRRDAWWKRCMIMHKRRIIM